MALATVSDSLLPFPGDIFTDTTGLQPEDALFFIGLTI